MSWPLSLPHFMATHTHRVRSMRLLQKALPFAISAFFCRPLPGFRPTARVGNRSAGLEVERDHLIASDAVEVSVRPESEAARLAECGQSAW
jgi:hypothetical protein